MSSKKNRDTLKTSTAIGAGTSLFALYILFLFRYYLLADWSNLSQIELWILTTQLLRLLVYLGVRRKYQLPPLVPIILFSVESLLIPPLLGAFVITGNAGYALYMGTVLTAWMGATSLVLSPYLIYTFAKSMTTDTSLLGVLALSGLEFADFVYSAVVLLEASTPIQGLSGLGAYLVSSLKGQALSVGVPFVVENPVIAVASLGFFLSLLLFASGGSGQERQLDWSRLLLLPLFSTVIIALWTAAAVVLVPDILLALTLPALLLAGIIWGLAREKGE